MFLTCIKVSSAALATLLAAHPYVALKHYYYTVIEPTTLNPPPPMSLLFIDYSPTALRSVSGWQTFFRVWRVWTSAYLRCDTQACVRRQRRPRPQKAVRPVTQRSQEWLMGAAATSRLLLHGISQPPATTAIISHDSWTFPTDGKTHPELVSTVMLIFLCSSYGLVTMVILVRM